MSATAPDLPPNFLDLLLDAVFMVDVHGRIVYISAACERIFGYTPDEMIGKAMIDFVFPEDRARTREEAMKVSINGRFLRMWPSIGIALYPEHGNGVAQLLKHADDAMYSAKRIKDSVPE